MSNTLPKLVNPAGPADNGKSWRYNDTSGIAELYDPNAVTVPVRTVTTGTTLLPATDVVVVLSAGATDVTLAVNSPTAGQRGVFWIRNDSGTNIVLINPTGSVTVNGLPNFTLTAGQSSMLVWDGIGWQALAGTGATASQAAAILAALITVDGAGSGLDADLLDGQSSGAYALAAELITHQTLADAHAASDVSFVPTGTIAAITVQDAIVEVAAETQRRHWVDVSEHATFAAAIDTAAAGATVFFPPGAYTASTFKTINTAGLTLLGYGATITGGTHRLFVVNADDVTFEGLTFVRSTTAAAFTDTATERSCVTVGAARFTSRNCNYTNAALACLYVNNGQGAGSLIQGGIFRNSSATQNGCAVYAAGGSTPTVDLTIDGIEVIGTGCPDGILLFDTQRATVKNCHVHDLVTRPNLTVGANWAVVSGNIYRTRLATGTNPGVDGPSTDRNDGPTRVVKVSGAQIGEQLTTPTAPTANLWGISGGYLYVNLNGTDPNTQTVTSGIVGGYGITFYSTNPATAPLTRNRAIGNHIHDVDGFGIYFQLGDATGVDNSSANNTIVNAARAGDQHTSLPFAGLGIIAGSRTVCVGDRVLTCGTPSTAVCDGIKVLPGATNIGGATFIGCTSNSNSRRGFSLSNDCHLLGCEGSSNTADGVTVNPPGATGAPMRNITIMGGEFSSNTLRGVCIDCTPGITATAAITGTTCQSNAQNGILVLGTTDSTVTGNTCNQNGSTSHAQIRVRVACVRTTVTGNSATTSASPSVGIMVDAEATNTVLAGNVVNAVTPYSLLALVRTGGTEAVGQYMGPGTPEAVVTAGIGSTFARTDGAAGTTFYVKESGVGNTGWAAMAAGLTAHEADTTSIHGIADTAKLVRTTAVPGAGTNGYAPIYDHSLTAYELLEAVEVPVTIADGGTGATTAGAALTALGAQPLDSDLTAIAALTTTSYGRSLLALADAAAALVAVGGFPAAQTFNAQTGTTYTVVLTDVSKIVTLTNAAGITCTLPQDSVAAVPIGTHVDFLQLGAGQVTFVAGTGATMNAASGTKISAQYGGVTAVKRAANTWIIVGELSA